MKLASIIKRVQFKLDDPDGTQYDDDYITGFVAEAQDWLYSAMKRTNSEFDSDIVILPGIAAGTPNLDAFQDEGQPLAALVNSPRMIRWRLPGQDSVLFRRAEGPLELVRDIADPGIALLDSWAWMRYSIKLSKISLSLDLEITGDFLFPPLAAPEDDLKAARDCNRALSCKIASDIGKARGNDKWKLDYGADADEALDDVNSLLVKQMQAYTNRVGRMSRSSGRSSRLTNR